jgi:hypothetical protein
MTQAGIEGVNIYLFLFFFWFFEREKGEEPLLWLHSSETERRNARGPRADGWAVRQGHGTARGGHGRVARGAALQATDGPRKGGTEVAQAKEEEREGGEGKGAVSPVGVGILPVAAGW